MGWFGKLWLSMSLLLCLLWIENNIWILLKWLLLISPLIKRLLLWRLLNLWWLLLLSCQLLLLELQLSKILCYRLLSINKVLLWLLSLALLGLESQKFFLLTQVLRVYCSLLAHIILLDLSLLDLLFLLILDSHHFFLLLLLIKRLVLLWV